MLSLKARIGSSRLFLLSLAAAAAATGCGSSEEPSGSLNPGASPTPAVKLTDTTPRSGLYAIAAPPSVAAGAVSITVRNRSARERGAQIVRVEGRRAPRRVVAALRAASGGKPLPHWLDLAGGAGVIRPRSKVSFTVILRPGRYYVVDLSHKGAQDGAVGGASTQLTVTRAYEQAELRQAAATITARDYSFRARNLGAGRHRLKLRNAGAQPHNFVISPIRPGRTLTDVRDYALGDESGPPPVDFSREFISGTLAPGQEQTLPVDLHFGRYALLCFASDREGGPPHIVKGMLAKETVK